MTDPLSTWKDGAVKNAILGYVGQTCAKGSADWVPAEERVAVFDNDGTLWCEKPMPIQLDFVLRRLAEMAELDPALRDRQPWKSANERDYGWLARVMTEHYAGDDTSVRTLGAGILEAFANIFVDQFEEDSAAFLRGRDRQRRRPHLQPPTSTGARSPAGWLPSTRTTGPRSRCTSGTARDDARSWLPATRTATSRCSTSPSTGASGPCDSWCCTTTPTASSTTSQAQSGPSAGRPARLDGGQHQERLGRGVLTTRPHTVRRAHPHRVR